MRRVRFSFWSLFPAVKPVTTPRLQIPVIQETQTVDPVAFIRTIKQYEFRRYDQDRLMQMLEEFCRKIVLQSADEIDLEHSKQIKEHAIAILTPVFKLRNKNYHDQALKDKLNVVAQKSDEVISSLPEAKRQGADFETFKATCELLDYLLTTDLFKNEVEKGIVPRP